MLAGWLDGQKRRLKRSSSSKSSLRHKKVQLWFQRCILFGIIFGSYFVHKRHRSDQFQIQHDARNSGASHQKKNISEIRIDVDGFL